MKAIVMVNLAALALASSGGIMAQQDPSAPRAVRRVEGELLVKFRGGPRGEAAERARRTFGHEVKRHFDFIGWQQIRLPAGLSVDDGLARFRRHPDVLAAEPNVLQERATGGVVNDPSYPNQYASERIGAPIAWGITNGSSNVVVAVIDTGINYNHEDLAANMWRNPGEIPGNGIDDDGNGFSDDVYGIDTADDSFGNDSDPVDQGVNVSPGGFRIYHGTSCAGIIGAVGGNGRGVVGVAPSVQIMALRALTAADTLSAADAIQALSYIVMMKNRGVNIRVVSMSFAVPFSPAQKDAHDAVAARGILQVTGAHNDGRDIDVDLRYPAAYSTSNLLTVAASEGFDNLASFSNFGRTNVDLAAPGIAIVTTHGPGTNDYNFSFNGTSSACPLVAGAAALLWAARPGASAAEIQAALLESVDVLPSLTNKVLTSGRLNLARAMYRFVSNGSPVIVAQPQPQTIPPNSSALLRVSVAGTEPLVYQWQFNGSDIVNATNPALALANVTGSHAGAYLVIASNAYGMITSMVAMVMVAPEPVTFTRITSGPVATTAANAVSGAWTDYNNDGWLDLFVATGFADAADFLYRNNSNGAFSAFRSGGVGTDLADSWAGAWGDYDNDGDADLFVANGGNSGSANNLLYRNDGGVFTRMTSAVGSLTTDGGASLDAAWADFDNDGWLDLFVSNGRLDGLRTNFLYRSVGNGTFLRITNAPPVTDGGRYFGVAAADYDNDGFTDLFVANGAGLPNVLYHNNRDGTFVRSAALDSLTDPAFTPSAAWGDYDNDGDLDLVLGRHVHCLILRNEGNGLFTRVNTGEPVEDVGEADSAVWIDYDNDGWLDLFVASESGINRLYHNNGDGSFRRVTTGSVATDVARPSVSSAWGDYDNDGFPDLFVANLGPPSFLYRNSGNSNHWLRVKCRGTLSNRDGVGAKVQVRATIAGVERWQLRQIGKGNSFGQQELAAAFGLGSATSALTVRVEWPSGTVQEVVDVAANQQLTLVEPGMRILQAPQDALVRLGANTNFSVAVLGDHPANTLNYQWLFNGTALPGQGAATLPINNVQLSHEGEYSVIVSDGLRSATSAVARLVVLVTPVIVQPPLSQSVVVGGDVTVSVAVSGRPASFGYLWRRGSSNLAFIVRSETNCFFTFHNVQTNQGGLHRVIVTNAASPGLVVNATFTLTVLADDDHDGLPDLWETQFDVSDPASDDDLDGLTNLQESQAGTNPTNARSYLKMEVIALTNNGSAIRLTFLAASNVTYTVEARAAADGGAWNRVADVIAASSDRLVDVIDAENPAIAERKYYRLVTPRRP